MSDLLAMAKIMESSQPTIYDPIDELFFGQTDSRDLSSEEIPSNAEMVSLFAKIEDNKNTSSLATEEPIDVEPGFEFTRLCDELGVESDTLRVIPIKVSSSDTVIPDEIDYNSRLKNHIDHLCDKYKITVVPREITGFSKVSVKPNNYTSVQVLGKCYYSSHGIIQENKVDAIVSKIKDSLKFTGVASISLFQELDTGIPSIGTIRTLAFNLDEIHFIAEVFNAHSPVLVETDNDYLLLVNPTAVPWKS